MTLSQRDRDTLERLEEELWREETRFDIGRMEELLAPDFVEFGRSGRVYRREDTLAVPRGPIDAVLPLPGFRARSLKPGDRAGDLRQRGRVRRSRVARPPKLDLVAHCGGLGAAVSPGHAD
jgi:hypothetical protein